VNHYNNINILNNKLILMNSINREQAEAKYIRTQYDEERGIIKIQEQAKGNPLLDSAGYKYSASGRPMYTRPMGVQQENRDADGNFFEIRGWRPDRHKHQEHTFRTIYYNCIPGSTHSGYVYVYGEAQV
jgi:hypothetical protein